jgi:lysozyme family protein
MIVAISFICQLVQSLALRTDGSIGENILKSIRKLPKQIQQQKFTKMMLKENKKNSGTRG